MDFADEKAREAQSEIMKMEVSSRVLNCATCCFAEGLCCCTASSPKGHMSLHALHF